MCVYVECRLHNKCTVYDCFAIGYLFKHKALVVQTLHAAGPVQRVWWDWVDASTTLLRHHGRPKPRSSSTVQRAVADARPARGLGDGAPSARS